GLAARDRRRGTFPNLFPVGPPPDAEEPIKGRAVAAPWMATIDGAGAAAAPTTATTDGTGAVAAPRTAMTDGAGVAAAPRTAMTDGAGAVTAPRRRDAARR